MAGNHKKSMHISVRDSLRKLDTDYIDILYIHWVSQAQLANRLSAESRLPQWDHTTSVGILICDCRQR